LTLALPKAAIGHQQAIPASHNILELTPIAIELSALESKVVSLETLVKSQAAAAAVAPPPPPEPEPIPPSSVRLEEVS
jgi:hypothetical protein